MPRARTFPSCARALRSGSRWRAGDWFGRPVNLASRITSIARPGSVLAEREVRESAREAYGWSYAGERRLRGVREPVSLFRAQRLAEPA
jgi:adenylate cyclase